MTRVIAPSRLHFGLFQVPEKGRWTPGERAFGGIGLMIDTPGVVVTVKPAGVWQFEGPLASRAQAFAMRFVESIPDADRQPFQVLVEQCPAEHTGLGVGTQLGLAVTKALAVAKGMTFSTAELAARVGRGERSGVGVHGFDHGGLVVENGKLADKDVSSLVASARLPTEWRVVLFTPPVPVAWHGPREREAFATARSGDTESLRQIAETAILPAARAGDLEAFGDAVYEFNRRAGEPFAAVQGGQYAYPGIAELINQLRNRGVHGVGQSSWGPTVFAVVGDSEAALSLVLQFRSQMPVVVAKASNGHRMERG